MEPNRSPSSQDHFFYDQGSENLAGLLRLHRNKSQPNLKNYEKIVLVDSLT
jgi:hypothetical protein